MAEPLKRFFDRARVEDIAREIAAVHPAFPVRAFVEDAIRNFPREELLARGEAVARALRAHLPADYPEAIGILVRSLGPELPPDGMAREGLAPFRYLPHAAFVRAHGVEHFEISMRAQHALTRRFTAEWSIRPFLERDLARTLAVLAEWTRDPSAHVRRLVSEGTRPRLPWAPRLRALQADPRPALPLLDALVDDPTEYVRRSVANHLNDVSRDHPDLAVEVARRWLAAPTPARRWVVRRALRSLVKAGHPGALAALGFGRAPRVRVRAEILPARVRVGGAVRIAVTVESAARVAQDVVVDLAVHFVKRRGAARPKVFKLRELALEPRGAAVLGKTISVAALSTRTPHPGEHRVDVLVNGVAFPAGAFRVLAAAPGSRR